MAINVIERQNDLSRPVHGDDDLLVNVRRHLHIDGQSESRPSADIEVELVRFFVNGPLIDSFLLATSTLKENRCAANVVNALAAFTQRYVGEKLVECLRLSMCTATTESADIDDVFAQRLASLVDVVHNAVASTTTVCAMRQQDVVAAVARAVCATITAAHKRLIAGQDVRLALVRRVFLRTVALSGVHCLC